MKYGLGFLATLLFLLIALALQGQENGEVNFQVIVNKANPTPSVSKDLLADIFLKKKTMWESWGTGKESIKPVDLVEQSAVRKDFSKEIHGKSPSAIKSFWQRMIFSGRGVPPEELATEKDVLDYVSIWPGAIGYVAKSTNLPADVKVLKVTFTP